MTKDAPEPTELRPPPLNHPLRSRDLLTQKKASVVDLTLTLEQRAALIDWFDLHDLAHLTLSGKFKAISSDKLRFEGILTAKGAQRCGVTLAPVPFQIDEVVQRDWQRRAADTGEIIVDPDADDDPDLLTDVIDIGEMATEELGLALPPWPRVPGAEFAAIVVAPPGVKPLVDDDLKPFAGLVALKNRLKPDNTQ